MYSVEINANYRCSEPHLVILYAISLQNFGLIKAGIRNKGWEWKRWKGWEAERRERKIRQFLRYFRWKLYHWLGVFSAWRIVVKWMTGRTQRANISHCFSRPASLVTIQLLRLWHSRKMPNNNIHLRTDAAAHLGLWYSRTRRRKQMPQWWKSVFFRCISRSVCAVYSLSPSFFIQHACSLTTARQWLALFVNSQMDLYIRNDCRCLVFLTKR